jgi:hypothetical protein
VILEIDHEDWNYSQELQDKYEFDGTRCVNCTEIVGGYLWVPTHSDTGVEMGRFDSIWTSDQDPERKPYCEDCAYELFGDDYD